MNQITLVWLQDLRIEDNPCLYEAAAQGKIFPVYIFDTTCPKEFELGVVSKIWLHYALKDLHKSLRNTLNVYQGSPEKIIKKIVKQHSITKVVWNHRYDPWFLHQEKAVKEMLDTLGVSYQIYEGSYLYKPNEVLKSDGSYYKVFGAYKKRVQASSIRDLLKKPKVQDSMYDKDNTTRIDDFNLLEDKEWHAKITKHWIISEDEAHQKLKKFIATKLSGYNKGRDYPADEHTSFLSAYLKSGQISPHQIWHAVHEKKGVSSEDKESFLSELIWREFSSYLLFHFKTLYKQNFQSKFDNFAWEKNQKLYTAWKEGKTGYPLIDAGMRQLLETGYMHNRVRMVVASFLIKNLMIDWREGMDWFWQVLVDGDLASNAFNWQWVAGSGVDAAPYFRIFNPTLQAKKFDKEGKYIKKFVPELKNMPQKYILEPWKSPDEFLKSGYYKPIVDLNISRKKALSLYKRLK